MLHYLILRNEGLTPTQNYFSLDKKALVEAKSQTLVNVHNPLITRSNTGVTVHVVLLLNAENKLIVGNPSNAT